MAIKVHTFTDMSSGNVYNESQCSDDIKMGDILVVLDEKVVGFLLSAWPVAVTVDHGAFHCFEDPSAPATGPSGWDKTDWTGNYKKACEVAKALGYQLADKDHPYIDREEEVEVEY